MGSVRTVVCLPGFGDAVVGEQWVADLDRAVGADVSVVAVDWPGLWTRWAEPVSFAALVDEVTWLAGPDVALVGHSLGGRVALQVAAAREVAAVVAVCSPAQLGINAGPAAATWRAAGARPTERVAPNGMPVSYQLPVTFLDELDATLGAPRIPTCPTMLTFGADDPKASPAAWAEVPQLGAAPAVAELAGCVHRFMDDPDSRARMVRLIADFLA